MSAYLILNAVISITLRSNSKLGVSNISEESCSFPSPLKNPLPNGTPSPGPQPPTLSPLPYSIFEFHGRMLPVAILLNRSFH